MTRNTLCLVAVLSLASCGGQTVAPDASSVILIVVDTLRADHLGLYGYDRPTSPTLDAWAAEARVFDNAYAPATWCAVPSSWWTMRMGSRSSSSCT